MKKTRYKIGMATWVAVLATLASCLIGVYFYFKGERAPDFGTAYARLGKRSTLATAYSNWVAKHEKRGGDRNIVLPLGWSKAFSGAFTRARGEIKLNVIDGSISVNARGLEEAPAGDVWLVDNRAGP